SPMLKRLCSERRADDEPGLRAMTGPRREPITAATRGAGALRIGVDLGGTKIEVAAYDANGRELARRRIPTPQHDYGRTLDALTGLVLAVEAELGTRGSVGIGMPGALSPASGLVKNANSVWLNGRPLDHALAERLQRPVRLANDANCFALS